MRSLPPPRKSRSRTFRKWIDKIYRMLTLQFIFQRRGSILIVKKRKTPFHFTSRQYKVKTSRGVKLNLKKKHWYSSKRRAEQELVTMLIMKELRSSNTKTNLIDKDFNIRYLHFQKPGRLRRFRIKQSAQRQRMRRVFKRVFTIAFLGRKAHGAVSKVYGGSQQGSKRMVSKGPRGREVVVQV